MDMLDKFTPPPPPELDALVAGATKDALIDAARAASIPVGDYARKTKAEIAEAILAACNTPDRAATVRQALAATTTKPAAPKPAPVPQDAGAALAAAVAAIAAGIQPQAPALDPEQVRALIRDEIAAAGLARPIALHIGDAAPVAMAPESHPLAPKVAALVSAGLNVLLVGPAGCGKTTLAHQVADALGLEFGALHCTAGASESQLLGWLLPTGDAGRFEYRPAQFARLYEAGNSLFLMDELDASDPNFLMVLNGALANGHLHIPQRLDCPTVKRGERACIMAAANTHGTGADLIYQGRNALDGATLDRFYIVAMDYDSRLEARIAGLTVPTVATWQPAPLDAETVAADCGALGAWILDVRAKAAAARLRRVISTRWIQKAAAARRAGVPVAEIKADLLAGWTADERAKVGG